MPAVRTSPARPRTAVLALAAIVATLLLAALAGCGSSSPVLGTVADPAGVIPASAPLYAGAIVRPSSALKTDALAAGRMLTHQTDPYLRLLQVLQTPGSPALDFSHDVSPWLGPQAGVFLTSLDNSSSLLPLLEQGLLGGSTAAASAFPFTAHGAQGAIVLDTTDVAKARSFLAGEAQRAGSHTTAYRGVTYQVSIGGTAFGVVARFAVIGSEAGLRDVIDTTLGGPSLARAVGYGKLLAAAPSGALAHVYANPSVSSGSRSPASGAGGASGLSGLLGLLAGAREENVSLVPSATSLALDADALSSGHATPAGGGGLIASSSASVRALAELPGESWLAVGLGDAGATLGADVQGLSSLTSLGSSASANGSATATGFSVKGVLGGMLTPLDALSASSAEAKRAFQSWMGSAGLFASGSGVTDLRGGVVIASHNPAGSRAAVAKLAVLLNKAGGSTQPISIPGTDAAISARVSGLPVELDIADGRAASGQTKFVIGLGEASVRDALSPSSTLSSTASFSAAASALGEGAQPSITVDFPSLLGLLEGVGLSEDQTISKFVPYLRALTTLAGGGHSLGGGIERFRLVLGLQQTSG